MKWVWIENIWPWNSMKYFKPSAVFSSDFSWVRIISATFPVVEYKWVFLSFPEQIVTFLLWDFSRMYPYEWKQTPFILVRATSSGDFLERSISRMLIFCPTGASIIHGRVFVPHPTGDVSDEIMRWRGWEERTMEQERWASTTKHK